MKPPSLLTASVLDNLASAVVVFDADLRVSYLNQMAEMLLAVSAKHVMGEPPSAWMDCHGEALLDLVRASTVGSPVTKRGVVLATERSEVTVDCTVTPMIDEDGERFTIAELQQVDRHLRISREERLIAQQTLTRDVVRGLAHEIKNPLGGLRGAAQLLEAELDSDELREYTRIIIQEADRLQGLLNRMLGPNRRPTYAPVNIHHVLERVRTLVVAEAGERIRVLRDYDPSIPELIGDMDQLIQAVLNIVRNAVRALGDEGTITLRTRIQRQLTIGIDRYRLAAQIDIVDDGPGIPPEIADTLFFPMVTAGTGGMGLGLSIAQSLINQHKGLVECHSRKGETVFTILLPLGEDPGSERQGDITHD
ncbi:MAG: nitrogen regulation protein NR(II) [Gammaproteobacteria bacterium]|nr:nitrogen regulation protein NR(II) [Gammaproteobacteria bacterium]MCB1924560.1 nitrogen regulation protein NR(II) [Gammaproteobacteria bacterium]